VADLAASPRVKPCLEWFRKERAWINEQHLKLCRIPAPTFLEKERAEWFAERFRSLGWEAKLDRAGNVCAWLAGRKDAASIAVTAHLDTVLAPRVPDDIKIATDGRLLGPGFRTTGLAWPRCWRSRRCGRRAAIRSRRARLGRYWSRTSAKRAKAI
jgi:hypothetical protein